MGKEFSRPEYIPVFSVALHDDRLQKIDCLVLGTIYWYERLKDGVCFASNKAISNVIGSKQITVVSNSLRKLEEFGYIKCTYKDKNKRNRLKIECLIHRLLVKNDSSTDDTSIHPQITRDSSTDEQNRIKNKNIELTTSEQSSQEDLSKKQMKKDIDQLIEKFQVLNASVAYGNKTQRTACQRMIETHGLEKIIKIVETVLPRTNARPRYEFPYVDTPHLLWTNWTKIGNGIAMQKQQKEIKKPIIHKR